MFLLQIDDAAKIKNSHIAKELSLPPVKLHCSSKCCLYVEIVQLVSPYALLGQSVICTNICFDDKSNFTEKITNWYALSEFIQFWTMKTPCSINVQNYLVCINYKRHCHHFAFCSQGIGQCLYNYYAIQFPCCYFSVLAEDAIQAALKDYRKKQDSQ